MTSTPDTPEAAALLSRLDIAHIIQDVIEGFTPFEYGTLVSHEGAITTDWTTPAGGNFVLTIEIARDAQPL